MDRNRYNDVNDIAGNGINFAKPYLNVDNLIVSSIVTVPSTI
ncbi:MAG: hypothetical protein ACOX3C_04120 [Bacilli bacterium]